MKHAPFLLVSFLCAQFSLSLTSPCAGKKAAIIPLMPDSNEPVKNHTSDNMLLIHGGVFQMGSPSQDADRGDDETQHTVEVSDFYLSKYEVTVAEFGLFVAATGYHTDAEKEDGSYIWNGSSWIQKAGVHWRHDEAGNPRPAVEQNRPVVHVSWNDATAYCAWLSTLTGQPYRLPTEAEWEYAAGNGSRSTKYSWGAGDPNGKRGGNVSDETARRQFADWSVFPEYADGFVFAAPVGSFEPNDVGLFDMTGNVWEWCSDWYSEVYYKSSAPKNPVGPDAGVLRVHRGGGWRSHAGYSRVAYRGASAPTYRDYAQGFRVARGW